MDTYRVSARPAAFILLACGLAAAGAGSARALDPAAAPGQAPPVRARFQADFARDMADRAVVRTDAADVALGRLLFSDRNLSLFRNQSCASCHQLTPARAPGSWTRLPTPGFVDPNNVEQGTPVSRGSIPFRSGALNAPSIGYTAFVPAFRFEEDTGFFGGGLFWNGRAATLEDQAGAPFFNPVEMAMSGPAAVVARLRESFVYRQRFKLLYGIDLGRPLTSPQITQTFSLVTRAIAAFERTAEFNRFTSKFDFFMAGRATLSDQERVGLELFTGKAQCTLCHPADARQNADGTWRGADFTTFHYLNIGAPRNLAIPGRPAPDQGLGGRADIRARDPAGEQIGRHRIMSLRNVAVTPPYAHNGVFKTLEQIVHFYNTRDTLGRVASNLDRGFGTVGWPEPEVARNVVTGVIGDLRLTPTEEAALVAFLKTLTDGFASWDAPPPVVTAARTP